MFLTGSARFLIAFVSFSAIAGEVTLTPAGVRNVGSSAAYAATCAKEGMLNVDVFAEFMHALQTRLVERHWLELKTQYQRSLHEKKQYTIASDRWLPFNISPESCSDLQKGIPIVLAALNRSSQR